METSLNDIEQYFLEKQKVVCDKYQTDFLASPFDKLIGVALESFDTFKMPINGLRHPIETEQSANWFIWAGDYSDRDDFFKPVHIHHLLQICPKAIMFLGLSPGWRFLFDNEYEDVWFDPDLLK